MAQREELVVTKVRENILNNNLIQNNDRIVIGLSGGPDSVFLLEMLQRLKNEFKEKYNIEYEMVICHINHMIRKEAKDDEKVAEEYAKKYGLEFYLKEADVKKISKENKMSEEECGRQIRYDFFNEIAKKCNCNKIAVAHNACDNAETILHNLMRGSGLNGLVGIKVKNGNIIRPIMCITKSEVIDYLDKKNIAYNIDKTNSENIYTRNKIRNDLIPKIEKEYNPNIISALNRMSIHLQDDIEYINCVAKEKYKKMLITKTKDYLKINIGEFNNEYNAIKKRIIIQFIEDFLGDVKGIENIHIDNICNMFEKCITGKRFSIGNKFSIIIEKGKTAKIIKNDVKK